MPDSRDGGANRPPNINVNDYSMEYDEDGSLALARALRALDDVRLGANPPSALDLSSNPCPVQSLNGSWYLQLTPRGPHNFIEIRGPMRIEVSPLKLRVSGDIYVNMQAPTDGPVEILRPIPENSQLFEKNWYPQMDSKQYSWYFRSLGVIYMAGKLVFKFERRLWDSITEEFISPASGGLDTGFMEMQCLTGNIFNHPLLPQPALRLSGIVQIGGETYDAVATKTSPLYRGCVFNVKVMANRSFPDTATFAGASISFASIFRTAGIDCVLTIDPTTIADDSNLSSTELQAALAKNTRPEGSNIWQLFMLIGSSQGDRSYGFMFDDKKPFREGLVGFFDVPLQDTNSDFFIAAAVENKRIGDVSAAFLRTLVHEAGHAFNLLHPGEDVHGIAPGTTIMNPTERLMQLATGTIPFPANITFAFDDHCRTSLIHSPDPQIAPGGKKLGWGHGQLSSGTPSPVDGAGFLRNKPVSTDLELKLTLPENLFRGEFVIAQFELINKGITPRLVSLALDLSMSNLRLLITPQGEEPCNVTDVILRCGQSPVTELKPNASISGRAQIFYTNIGHTFRRTGRYYVSAELKLRDVRGTVAQSNLATVVVRGPGRRDEQEIAALSMDAGVGLAFALGDFGYDLTTKAKLETLAEKYGHTETGAAAALTLANSHGRDMRDLYTGKLLRKGASDLAQQNFEIAVKHHSKIISQLATAVVAATEHSAPLINQTADYLNSEITKSGVTGSVASDTFKASLKTLSDFRNAYRISSK